MHQRHKNILYIVVAFAIAIASWTPLVDQPAKQYAEAGMKRAVVSFASARALNAVISAVQGTQFSAQPLGVGMTVTPGQLLAPVNAVVGHFADLMLVASVALGTEQILIKIGGWPGVSIALTLVVAAWAALAVTRRPRPAWVTRLLVALLLVRFAVPLSVITSEWVWQQFLAQEYAAHQVAIQSSADDASRLDAAPSAEAAGVAERIKSWFTRNVDVKARFDELKKLAEAATGHIVSLMVIFLLQTLIVPVLMLWLICRTLWGLLVRPVGMHAGGQLAS